MPILSDFVKLMNKKFNNFSFVFHATSENKNHINDYLQKLHIDNTQVISDENIKYKTLLNSIFAVAKSGTISLEICNFNIPSIIIYKINFINYNRVLVIIRKL